jgi:hypothetical protein
MSVLERIVRHRRASASRRLGPPPDAVAHANGNGAVDEAAASELVRALAPPPAADVDSNGSAPSEVASVEPSVAAPGFRERGRMRRRIRYLRRLREVQLRDAGGFLVELRRFDCERPDLVQAKLDYAAQTDAELRALERALNEQHPLRALREPGIGGACPECGAVHGSEDRFCASCGGALREDADVSEPDPLADGLVYPE